MQTPKTPRYRHASRTPTAGPTSPYVKSTLLPLASLAACSALARSALRLRRLLSALLPTADESYAAAEPGEPPLPRALWLAPAAAGMGGGGG